MHKRADMSIDAAINSLRQDAMDLIGALIRTPDRGELPIRSCAIETLQRVSNELGALEARCTRPRRAA